MASTAEPPDTPPRPAKQPERPADFDPRRRPREGDGPIVSMTSLALARLLRLRAPHGPRPTGQVQRDALDIPRRAIFLAILLVTLLFLALLVVFFLPRDAAGAEKKGGSINFDRPVKDWYQGPVRYIITKQEVKAYKALESEIDRRNFIDWFWQRRDIVQATPQNEFRDRYEQRVLESMRMFSETTIPGWKTDMGKIYVLVGPPDEINRDVMAKTHRGIVTWVYRRPPFPDLPANTVVAFAKDQSGEFRISASPTLDSDVARGLQFARVKRTADDRYIIGGRDPVLLDQGVPLSQGVLETMMVGGRLQQLPPHEEEMFRAFTQTREYYGTIPADSRFDFYRAGDGTTYTTLTIGIKSTAVQYRTLRGGKEIPDVAVFGKLVNKHDPTQEYALAGDTNFTESADNAEAGPGDLLTFQATGGFKPGSYELVLGVQDRVSKKVAAYRRDVVIPDLSGGSLTLSSITLAGTMEPVEHKLSSPAKAFHLGKFRVVPRPDNRFTNADELNVYFQVYDPAVDATSGRPRLDIVYAFRVHTPEGPPQEMGAYEVKGSGAQVQGYAVPLDKWPAAEYEVTVTVRDTIGGATVSGTAGFVIAAE